MNLRTASLAAALIAAAVSSLPASANAQWRGGWGWGGFGAGLAAGAVIGGALAAPYYSYGYAPSYSYSYAPSYSYGYAPSYSNAYAPGYSNGYAPSYSYGYAPVTAMAQPLACMPMLRIGDTGGGTIVDESERFQSLVIFRGHSDQLEEDRRRRTIYAPGEHVTHSRRVPMAPSRRRTRRVLNASAISLRVVAPAFPISRMIGSTLAARLSAAAPMASNATLYTWASFGPPSFTPRALAAAGAAFVRVLIIARSFCASALPTYGAPMSNTVAQTILCDLVLLRAPVLSR